METLIIAHISPGEMFQIGRESGLSFTASERLNKLQYVELRVEYDDSGNVINAKIETIGTEAPPPGLRLGWPFRYHNKRGSEKWTTSKT